MNPRSQSQREALAILAMLTSAGASVAFGVAAGAELVGIGVWLALVTLMLAIAGTR